jgi:glutaredoxin-like protein NrdH
MTVTVFTTGPGCHLCYTTKIHLKRRGIQFDEVRLDENPDLAEVVRDLGFTTAPVVLIDEDDVWAGYSADAIDALASEMSCAG